MRADHSWRTFVSSIPKGLAPSKRPFLGHGGLNDAEWHFIAAVVSLKQYGPMEKDHQVGSTSTLRSETRWRFSRRIRIIYIYPNVWTFRGPARLEILSQLLTEAEAAGELCARILEVEKALVAQILA